MSFHTSPTPPTYGTCQGVGCLDGQVGVHDDVDLEHEAAVVAIVHLHLAHGGDVRADVKHRLRKEEKWSSGVRWVDG